MPFDPFSPEFQKDPYAAYKALRDHDPVHWSTANAWVLTRYEDVRNVLMDQRMNHWGDAQNSAGAHFHTVMNRWVRHMHPASQSSLRAGILRAMSSQALANEGIEAIVDELVHAMPKSSTMNAIADLAEPLTLSVGGALMGVEQEELPFFRRLVLRLMPHIFSVIALPVEAAAPHPVAEFRSYIANLVRRKQEKPDSSLATALLESADAGDYTSFSAIFILASTQNMMNFVGNMVLALAQHPQVWRQLQENPSLTGNAVEEFLRFDSAVQFVALTCGEDTEIHGRRIRAGQTILASIGAANHDPRQFSEPEQLDIKRGSIPHLTFGAGGLYCVGAALARVEGRAVCSALTKDFPPATLDNFPLQWRRGPGVLRGLASLPLKFKSEEPGFQEQDAILPVGGGGLR